jgi:hypothetical protein
MKTNYRMFFELQREPFCSDIELDYILLTPSLKGVEERIHYAVGLGGHCPCDWRDWQW